MKFLEKLTDYLYRAMRVVRERGPIEAFRAARRRARAAMQPKPHIPTLQEWLHYYQRRKELYPTPALEDEQANTPRVSILILTYNNLPVTKICLHSIYCNTTYRNFEVIVVDNASKDKTPHWLKSYGKTHPNLKIILNRENRGFAGGNNQAAREAMGKYLVFLNNDTIVTQGWVERLLAHMESDPKIGLVGPVTNSTGNEARIPVSYNSPAAMEAFAAHRAQSMAGQSFDIRMLAFFCVMARKDQYDLLGGLDERFLVGMFEDDDLAVRYHEQGLRVVCADDVFIHHFQRTSFGKIEETRYNLLFAENRRKYEEKWGREWQPYQSRPEVAATTIVPSAAPSIPGQWGILSYRCNLCGRACKTHVRDLGREQPTCTCGSKVRTRAIIHLLSMELFGESIALPDFPVRRDIKGWGMSDTGFAELLAQKLGYVNTYYHQAPRLDITEPVDPAVEATLDFLISSEVFEHIAPPVSRAFLNARRLLKSTGVLILSVPYTMEAETREHFPELHQYEFLRRKDNPPLLKNTTVDGREQLFDHLVFHGGEGETLEMRVFSQAGLLAELSQAGFGTVRICSEPCWEYGIYSSDPYSLPLIARPT